jgi:hypothetical protein
MRLQHVAIGLSLIAATAAGCTSSSGDDENTDGTYNCANETRATPYSPGMEVDGAGGKLAFKLVQATPDPPMSGNNDWVIEIDSMADDVAGAPMAGATMTVYPYMPDHQHTTPIAVGITAGSASGQYELTPVNLWMPGFWTITIDATAPDGTKDTGVFDICIPS